MALQLNEPTLHYKEFYGRNIDQMPKLLAEGRVPLLVSDLMKRRLEVLTASPELKSVWWDNYFDTGDAVAYHPDGKVKLVLDAQSLRELTPESKLSNGALVLPDGLYETLEGEEFTQSKIEKYTQKELTKRSAQSNPFWKTLARDPELLKEYVNSVFSQAKERFDYNKNMGIYLASSQSVLTMRPWYVTRLDNGGSRAGGGGNLLDSGGRLLGVAPEAPVETRAERDAVLNTPEKSKSPDQAVIIAPTLEDMLAIVNNPDFNREDMVKEITKKHQ